MGRNQGPAQPVGGAQPSGVPPMTFLPFPSVVHCGPAALLSGGKVGLRGYVSTELDEVPSDSPGFAAQAHYEAIVR